MNLGINDIIKLFTVFQILFVSIFLLFNFKGRPKKNLLLSVFILSKAFSILDTFLIGHYNETFNFASGIMGIGFSFQLILGPALYFIIIEITQRKVELKLRHILHLVPFFIYVVWIVFNYQIHDNATKLVLLQNGFPFGTPWFRIVYTGFYIQFTIYSISSLLVLSKFKDEIYKISSQSVAKNIFFLRFLIYDFIIFWGTNIVSMFVNFGQTGYHILGILTTLNIFFIANAIVYQGLKFPQIFNDETNNKQKYEKNSISEEEKVFYANKLQEFMTNQKSYLNPTLSLSDLAKQIDLSPFILSQVMNQSLKQNFYDFINNYRIEESKRLLSGSNNDGMTILEILYQCGFNSKSVFNSAFKKNTGMTPSEFKKAGCVESLHN